MVEALQWSGGDQFRAKALRNWLAPSANETLTNPSGQVKAHGGLTFLTIEGAGHMASVTLWRYPVVALIFSLGRPFDQPESTLYMFEKHLANEAF